MATVWGWDLLNTAFPATAHPLWIARHEALNLSGFPAIALMSLVDAAGDAPGLAGGAAGRHGPRSPRAQVGRASSASSFAAVHWLVEMGVTSSNRDRSRGPAARRKVLRLSRSPARPGQGHGRVGDLRTSPDAGHHAVEALPLPSLALLHRAMPLLCIWPSPFMPCCWCCATTGCSPPVPCSRR